MPARLSPPLASGLAVRSLENQIAQVRPAPGERLARWLTTIALRPGRAQYRVRTATAR